ncbi:hypothetical protein [Ferribacterium limneticum]|uniref:hypothetical protein n=1 Tax=Ferribacterium limneticum TaxID=76259 RepID=UPI001CF9EB85|nr:hypothetical protein [Ferribacterium limneticum]UCV28300.1 hypothetical protein KI617_18980 [Ferribacterium limneticum]UCV32217.1 hypothetical protein KI608_18980 [Ferribacterium limneticum]
MANDERHPLDLLVGGALIVLNLGLTVVGALNFGGGPVGLLAYIVVPGTAAWVLSRLFRRRRQ